MLTLENVSIKDDRIKIAFLTAIGFCIVIGLYEGVELKHTPPGMPRTHGQKVAYLIEAMWEAAFFGFGLGFFVVYGLALKNVESGPLRRRCIAIWLSISYFFMSWWPHASAHQYLNPGKPRDFIILEMCLHWPSLIAALVLCYFQFDVLLISYDVALNNKELRNYSPKDDAPAPWYKDIRLHAIVITVLCSVGWAIFQWHYNPFPPFVTWEKGFFICIYVADGLSSGIGCGFIYAASRITHRLPKRRTRIIGGISIGCIGFLLLITSPHPVAHFKYAFSPDGTLYVEYFFHLSITAAVSMLGFYQHRFLMLSIKGQMGMMMKFKDKNSGKSLTTSDTEMQSVSSSGVSLTRGNTSSNMETGSVAESNLSDSPELPSNINHQDQISVAVLDSGPSDGPQIFIPVPLDNQL